MSDVDSSNQVESLDRESKRGGLIISLIHGYWGRRPIDSSKKAIKKAISDFIKNQDKNRVIRILDPFCGGGSIPYAALLLKKDYKLEIHASDLNPVAVLITKATVEYPYKYGRRLIREVERWANMIYERLQKDLEKYYSPDSIAYIFHYQVKCPYCGSQIPLYKTNILEKSKDKIVGFEYKDDRIQIVTKTPDDFQQHSTVERDVFKCPKCKYTGKRDELIEMFNNGLVKDRLEIVIIKDKDNDISFRPATQEDRGRYELAKRDLNTINQKWINEMGISGIPDEPMPTDLPDLVSGRGYYVKKWGELFNSRQLLSSLIIADHINRAYREMILSGYNTELAEVISLYLAFILDKILEYNNKHVSWHNQFLITRHITYLQAIHMVWDYAELNPIASITGSWRNAKNSMVKALEKIVDEIGDNYNGITNNQIRIEISKQNALNLEYQTEYFDLIVTDPPYYDMIKYFDLSNFFYVWLKRSLKGVGSYYDLLFVDTLIPTDQELVHNPYRYHDSEKRYERMFIDAMKELDRVTKHESGLVLMYSYKKEKGWNAVIKAISKHTDYIVNDVKVVRTEREIRKNAQMANLLNSSTFLFLKKSGPKEKLGYINRIYESALNHIKNNINNLSMPYDELITYVRNLFIKEYSKYMKVIDLNQDKDSEIEPTHLGNYVNKLINEILNLYVPEDIDGISKFYIILKISGRTDSIFDYDDLIRKYNINPSELDEYISSRSKKFKIFQRKEKDKTKKIKILKKDSSDIKQAVENTNFKNIQDFKIVDLYYILYNLNKDQDYSKIEEIMNQLKNPVNQKLLFQIKKFLEILMEKSKDEQERKDSKGLYNLLNLY